MIKTDKSLIISSFFFFIFSFIRVNSTTYPIYATSCATESATRVCPQGTNTTQYLLSLKKGGSDVLSSNDYDSDFFLCQQYTFDCGYVQDQNQTISIANGIQLDMNSTQLNSTIPANPTLANKIRPYLGLSAADAKCGMKLFPLTLTSTQSNEFFTGYMTNLINSIKTKYTAQKLNSSLTWAAMNINIKTAVAQVIKQNKGLLNGSFWDDFKWNNFTQMSSYLKNQFKKTNQLYLLRSAYMIDSVTLTCNKIQNVNFLVDESGSIGAANFQMARQFLSQYVSGTNDDPSLMSIHFYDSSFDPHLDFGKTKAQLLTGIANKTYRSGGTQTGTAINATIAKILAANFDKGLNKILIVMTDGYSYDSVKQASDYARSKDITMISVGIGSNTDYDQLLQIAETPSNVIEVTGYSDLPKLVKFISNYFCKQIINLRINETIVGNTVKVPESPAYFRVQKSKTSQHYQLRIDYQTDPDLSQQQLYTSQYDPFPDSFSEYTINQTYRTSATQRVYFISPQQVADIRSKKELYTQQTIQSSYVSVGGNNMRFNISLLPCKTNNCIAQKATYQSYGSKADSNPLSDKDYNIYGIIAASIAGLICLSLLGATALKKIYGDEQPGSDMLKNIQPQITQEDINQNQSNKLRSQNSKRSNRSQKSNSSNKSNKSDRNHGEDRSNKSYKGKNNSSSNNSQKLNRGLYD